MEVVSSRKALSWADVDRRQQSTRSLSVVSSRFSIEKEDCHVEEIDLSNFFCFRAGSGLAHWKFNNDGTDSIGAADCTLQNGASYSTDSKEGSHSLSLDGIDDYAIPTASGVMYDPFREETVAIWFKAASTSGTHVLFNEGGWTNGLTIRINAGTLQAAVRIGTNQATASTSFASTEWTHVAVTFDNGSLRLYVNAAAISRAIISAA